MRRIRGLIFIGCGAAFLLTGLIAPFTSGNPLFLFGAVVGAALVALGVFSFRSGTRGS